MIVAIGAKYGENYTVSQLAMQSFKGNKNLKSDSGWSHKIYQCSVLRFSAWKKKLYIINTSRYVKKKKTKIISLLYPIIALYILQSSVPHCLHICPCYYVSSLLFILTFLHVRIFQGHPHFFLFCLSFLYSQPSSLLYFFHISLIFPTYHDSLPHNLSTAEDKIGYDKHKNYPISYLQN